MSHADFKRGQYESWVRAHATDLYRLAYRLCGKMEVAEDLVQETFYHAWRSADSLSDISKARAWLFQILRHRYAHLVRDNSRRPHADVPLDDDNEYAPASLASSEKLGMADDLQQALDQLDDRFKQPLLMVFLDGFSCRQAAEQLRLPLGTVLSRIHRAKLTLKSFFDRSNSRANRSLGGIKDMQDRSQ